MEENANASRDTPEWGKHKPFFVGSETNAERSTRSWLAKAYPSLRGGVFRCSGCIPATTKGRLIGSAISTKEYMLTASFHSFWT